MPKYIERESLLKRFRQNSITKLITFADGKSIFETVKDFPTADVAEVVRCKDCRYYHSDTKQCESHTYFNESNDLLRNESKCVFFIAIRKEDDFCSYGVKKNGR